MTQASEGISFVDVGRTFLTREGTKLTALETVRFDVHPGEFVSLLGPSGCGKTTLLRMVAGLLSPSWGKIVVGGSEVTGPGSCTVAVLPEESTAASTVGGVKPAGRCRAESGIGCRSIPGPDHSVVMYAPPLPWL